MSKQLGHKDIKIKQLEKRIKQLESMMGGKIDAEYEAKIDRNSWEKFVFDDIIPTVKETLEKVKKREWSWGKNQDCKYIDIRIDMRDGGAILCSRSRRISLDQLKYQWKPEDEKQEIPCTKKG